MIFFWFLAPLITLGSDIYVCIKKLWQIHQVPTIVNGDSDQIRRVIDRMPVLRGESFISDLASHILIEIFHAIVCLW